MDETRMEIASGFLYAVTLHSDGCEEWRFIADLKKPDQLAMPEKKTNG